MLKTTKTLKEYINTLPLLGTVLLIGGTYFMFLCLNINQPGDWLLYYFHFKVLGVIVCYWYQMFKYPGARVTLNFDIKKYDSDEKALYDLVVKYRSKVLMFMLPLIYIIADFIVNSFKMKQEYGSVEGYFTSFAIGGFIGITFCSGIKYLSAWWNIKRNWNKEFK